MRAHCTASIVFALACTQPEAPPPPDFAELNAAVERIDAAADKLQTAATALESSARALEQVRAVPQPAPPAPPVPAPVPEPAAALDPALAGAIKCPSEGKCTMTRAAVDRLLADPATLARQMRIVPNQKDGAFAGFRLFGIRRGSLPSLFGLQNGDTIVRIGDAELGSIDDAMKAAGDLRDADRVVLELTRRGERLLLEIAIEE